MSSKHKSHTWGLLVAPMTSTLSSALPRRPSNSSRNSVFNRLQKTSVIQVSSPCPPAGLVLWLAPLTQQTVNLVNEDDGRLSLWGRGRHGGVSTHRMRNGPLSGAIKVLILQGNWIRLKVKEGRGEDKGRGRGSSVSQGKNSYRKVQILACF